MRQTSMGWNMDVCYLVGYLRAAEQVDAARQDRDFRPCGMRVSSGSLFYFSFGEASGVW